MSKINTFKLFISFNIKGSVAKIVSIDRITYKYMMTN